MSVTSWLNIGENKNFIDYSFNNDNHSEVLCDLWCTHETISICLFSLFESIFKVSLKVFYRINKLQNYMLKAESVQQLSLKNRRKQ